VLTAVLDANVLARGIVAPPDSTAEFIADCWANRRFQLVTSDHIRRMLQAALRRPYFQERLTPTQIAIYDLHLRLRARWVKLPCPGSASGVVEDPEDDVVLSTAICGDAPYLVSQDKHLLSIGGYDRVVIMTMEAFAHMLRADLGV
jgi:uncharacterized protein